MKRFDLKVTTVGDYTIEMKITKKMITAYKKKERRRKMQGKPTFEEQYYGSPALGFKMALKDKFERELLFFTEDRMQEFEKKERWDDDCLKLFKSFKTVD